MVTKAETIGINRRRADVCRIAARLLGARYKVVMFASVGERCAHAAEAGCTAVSDLAGTASGVDVLMTVLPGLGECRDVMIGDERSAQVHASWIVLARSHKQ